MRNKKIIAIVGVAAVMIIGGTFAYFQQVMNIENPFDTGKYDSVIVEDFNPSDGDNWEPGATVDKKVEVKNTGDYDILVRVKFEEKWKNKSNAQWTKTNTGMDAITVEQESAVDGLIANDKSVVSKTLSDAKWVYNDTDKYWYYNANLKSTETTGTFLEAVTLLENADMGKYEVSNYYTESATRPSESELSDNPADVATKWVKYTGLVPDSAKHSMAVTELQPDALGYANADYTLTITAETIQATEAAMNNAFKLSAVPSGCTWNLTQNK